MTPLTRVSRSAASSPSTMSITVTGRLPKMVTAREIRDRVTKVERQHHVRRQAVALDEPDEEQAEEDQDDEKREAGDRIQRAADDRSAPAEE